MNELFVPAMGMAPGDVTLVSWLKSPGDPVMVGDVVAVVETSKAELEIAADAEGVLGRQLFAEHALVTPGGTIAYVLAPGESEPAASSKTTEPTEPQVPVQQKSALADLATPRYSVSPRRRREQAEAAAAAKLPEPPSQAPPVISTSRGSVQADPATTNPESRYRGAISASVSRSWQEIPHFAVTRELRVGRLSEAAVQWRAVVPGLTFTDLLLRSLALGLVERDRNPDLDLGLAVATERGVAIPVIRSVLRLSLVGLVDARRSAVERARAGRLIPDDGRTPASTLSNLGALGVDQFTGVVPYGQTSMLTVGRAAERPVVADGRLAVATTMHATLNVDHRSWDGVHAGELLSRLAQIVAAPTVFYAGDASLPEEL
jgi:pyruvate dehydrogenase E2 component (dihydrolipoamide acetyltransferase)